MADSKRDLGVAPVPAERVGQRLVEIAGAGRGGQRLVPRERGQHPRLELRGVGHHQDPAGVGHHGPPQHPRDLQRAAAPGRPAPGHHAADHVLGVEPAAGHPLLQPGPAVRGVQPGEFLVLQQQRGGRVVHLAQHVRAGGGHPDAVGGQRPQHLRGRVGVHRAAAERGRDLGRQDGQARRAQPGQRPAAEHAGQQRRVHVGAPGQPVAAHLGGHQAGRGLRGREQREPARVLVGRDPPQLVGMHREQGVQRRLRAGEGRVGGLEQHRLARRGGPHGRWPRGGRRAAQPGPGRRQRGRLAVLPVPGEQQGLGQRHIVTALHPHPGTQQRRVHLAAGRPYPAHVAGPLTCRHRRGKIIMRDDAPVAGAVRRRTRTSGSRVQGRRPPRCARL